ncbi:TRAP transporter substrate-binding protein DctP [Breoghania sp.]|uniref:TRAP transporter substrate-binding protein n=1 Tax=Breoghania sp. TaxID=2065378 RepID=UPI002AA6F3BE|nr:TRAP transporter substrate-binding protein DctP [Breoghania sp.]
MTFARLALAGAVAFALSAPLATTGAQAEQTTLRITLQLPIKSHIGQNLLDFKKDVEARSGGEISVEIYDSAQLYKDSEIPNAVASGAIEMGTASSSRFVGDVPAIDIFYVPFMFNTEDLVRKATAPGSTVRAPLDAAVLETGARVLWWQAYGGSVVLSNGGPIKSPADLKNKKVRVYGKTLGKWIEAAGGAPTLISGSEQYMAYQRGTVDIGMSGASGVRSRRLWDVMDTMTMTNSADTEFVVIINEKFWQGLSEQHRAWISESGLKVEKEVRDAMSSIEQAAVAEAEAAGMTVYYPTDEEIATWSASVQPVVDDYLANSGELGKKVYEGALALRD